MTETAAANTEVQGEAPASLRGAALRSAAAALLLFAVLLGVAQLHNMLFATLLSAAIAMSMGLALWLRSKSDQRLQRTDRQLQIVNALLNVSRALGSNVGLDNILPVIVNKTSEVMSAERTSLFLYDKERHTLKSRVMEGLDDEGLRISDERGIVGRVARSGQPANVADPHADPDFDAGFDKEFGFHTRNMLVVPVFDSKHNVIAVLQALNRKRLGPFDHDDELLMEALAAQAQVALERELASRAMQEKQKLDSTLKFAQSIQMGMLPTHFPKPGEGPVELHAILIPAKLVGGDFYDFVDLGDGMLGLVVADVSGKGMPAALMMAKAMTLIRAFSLVGIPPSETLRQANDELARDNHLAMFVTVFIAILDTRSGQMVYANGGHNPPLYVRGGEVREILGADSVPLGTMPDMEFAEARFQLEAGDLLYFFTDGVNEAMSPDYEEYGDTRMREMVLQAAALPVLEITHGTISAVRAHAAGAEQSDDITVMAVRWTAPALQAEPDPAETALPLPATPFVAPPTPAATPLAEQVGALLAVAAAPAPEPVLAAQPVPALDPAPAATAGAATAGQGKSKRRKRRS